MSRAGEIAGWGAIAETVGITSDRLSGIAHLLAHFPANGKPQDRDAAIDAVLLGFIERHEVTKPCRECGTARPDYSYHKVTASGKLFSATIERLREIERTNTP
jgi:hypothetical protein